MHQALYLLTEGRAFDWASLFCSIHCGGLEVIGDAMVIPCLK